MNENMHDSNTTAAEELKGLYKAIKGKDHLLIIIHNNPDPDAIASAAALKYLVEKQYDIQTSVAYGGYIGRAENRTMVKKAGIHLKQIHKISYDKYGIIAMVDTQPGAGNVAVPDDVHCHIVIDHHPKRGKINSEFAVIKPDIGVTATILVQWLNESEIHIPADLATVLAYAISSETQSMGRETSRADIQAYLSIYVKANLRKLAQIIYPKLPRNYFVTLAKTLHHAVVFRNLICAHLGNVPVPEIVSEMADFLVRHERIGWSFCTGRFKGHLILSVRTTNTRAKAGKLVKSLVIDSKTVGGHDMMAGGYIPLQSGKQKDLKKLEEQLTQNFAELMGYEEAKWKSLLDDLEKNA